jgi:type I restriction enzyme, S subunit
MKEGWEKKRLGDILQKTETVNPLLSPEDEFEYIDVSSVSNSSFQIETTQRLKGSGAPSRARKLVRSNDIIFATIRPTLQRIAVVPAHLDRQVCSTGYFVLRPRQGIDHRFVFYYLFSEDFMGQMEALQKGASYPAVTDGEVRAQEIPIPPLPEQQRIVGMLDEAFEGIATAKANAEKNLENARAVFESELNAIFTKKGDGWEEKRLGDLSRITYGYTQSASAEKVGPHFLRITDIQDNRVDWSTVPYCPIEASDYPKYKLTNGDIVFARTGATTGKSYLVTNPPESVFASYLIRVQLGAKELLPEFVNLFFQTPSYWETIRSGVSGSAQGGFNATKLGELSIPFPKSPEEQQTIVGKLDALVAETQRLESIYQRKLSELDDLKKSLLHHAFTGHL